MQFFKKYYVIKHTPHYEDVPDDMKHYDCSFYLTVYGLLCRNKWKSDGSITEKRKYWSMWTADKWSAYFFPDILNAKRILDEHADCINFAEYQFTKENGVFSIEIFSAIKKFWYTSKFVYHAKNVFNGVWSFLLMAIFAIVACFAAYGFLLLIKYLIHDLAGLPKL